MIALILAIVISCIFRWDKPLEVVHRWIDP